MRLLKRVKEVVIKKKKKDNIWLFRMLFQISGLELDLRYVYRSTLLLLLKKVKKRSKVASNIAVVPYRRKNEKKLR